MLDGWSGKQNHGIMGIASPGERTPQLGNLTIAASAMERRRSMSPANSHSMCSDFACHSTLCKCVTADRLRQTKESFVVQDEH